MAAIAICRHRSDTAAREEQQRFEELANAVPALIWTADKDGNGTYCNRQLLATLGNISTANWGAVIHPDDREEAITRYQTAMLTNGVYSVEHRNAVQPSGEYRWFNSRCLRYREIQQVRLIAGTVSPLTSMISNLLNLNYVKIAIAWQLLRSFTRGTFSVACSMPIVPCTSSIFRHR